LGSPRVYILTTPLKPSHYPARTARTHTNTSHRGKRSSVFLLLVPLLHARVDMTIGISRCPSGLWNLHRCKAIATSFVNRTIRRFLHPLRHISHLIAQPSKGSSLL